MNLNFINRIIKHTLLLAIICLVMGFFYHFSYGTGILLGAMWSCLNLLFMKNLLQQWLTLKARSYIKTSVLAVIKFPLLYLAGYQLLKISYFQASSLIIGFSLIFIVLFFEGVGALFLEKSTKNTNTL